MITTDLPEQPWPDGVMPEDDQLADWIFSMTAEQVELWIKRVRPTLAAGNLCWQMNHEDRVERIQAVLAIDPADHASKSRDYGRGFADALRLVKGMLA